MVEQLKRYEVTLTRAATESASVIVEAATPEAANEKALEQVGRYGEHHLGWTLDEGNMHDVYLPDPGSAEEVEG